MPTEKTKTKKKLSKKAKKAAKVGKKPSYSKKNIPDLPSKDKKEIRAMAKSLMGQTENSY